MGFIIKIKYVIFFTACGFSIVFSGLPLADPLPGAVEWPFGCHRREFNISHKVINPETEEVLCEVVTKSWACYGSCPTWEYDTPDGVKGQQDVCGFGEFEEKTKLLDCPKVAEEELKTIRYHEATTCSCRRCDDNGDTKCLSRKKKKEEEYKKRGGQGYQGLPSPLAEVKELGSSGSKGWGSFQIHKSG